MEKKKDKTKTKILFIVHIKGRGNLLKKKKIVERNK